MPNVFSKPYHSFTLALLFSVCASNMSNAQAGSKPYTKSTSSQVIQSQAPKQLPMVVIADIHGDYQSLIKLLRKTEIIDQNLNWSGGERYLVSLGDLLDRGPDSRKVLDLFIQLEEQAHQSGGSLQMVMGNHEAMNIRGDLRYVSKEEFAAFAADEDSSKRLSVYKDYLSYSNSKDTQESLEKFSQLYPEGYFGLVDAFAPNGKYGSWLLKRGFILKLQNKLFAHGGYSKKLIETGLNIRELNQQFRSDLITYSNLWRELIDDGLFKYYFSKKERVGIAKALIRGEVKSRKLNKRSIKKKAEQFIKASEALIFDSKGPTWYRGNLYCHEYSESKNIDDTLEYFDATQIFLGHTPDKSRLVRSRFNGKVIMLDTGMLQTHYKGHPSAVLIDDDDLSIVNIDDPSNKAPSHDPVRKPLHPNGFSDETLRDYYSKAKVVSEKPLGDFYTKPLRLSFEHQGIKRKAIFKYLDTDPNLEDKRWKRIGNFADRFIYELAAFELDRLLNLNMIPFTMPYKHNKMNGVLQYWVEDSVSKSDLIKSKSKLSGYCSNDEAKELMVIFDWLIYNEDRNTGNELYTEDDGQLWLIDHTRAFRVKNNLPEYKRFKPATYLSDSFREKLLSLDSATLQKKVGNYLNRKQIKSLLTRRDLILKRL